MISEGEPADIIYGEMTAALLTPPSAVRVQYAGACTQARARAGRQPMEADYFSECCHFGRKHLNKIRREWIPGAANWASDRRLKRLNRGWIWPRLAYGPREHVRMCANGMQPAVLYVWAPALQSWGVRRGLFGVLQSRGLFILQGKIDEAHLEGRISHSQREAVGPRSKTAGIPPFRNTFTNLF